MVHSREVPGIRRAQAGCTRDPCGCRRYVEYRPATRRRQWSLSASRGSDRRTTHRGQGPAADRRSGSSARCKDEKGDPGRRNCRASPNGLVRTTVGRVIFNDILHPKMAFYDLPLARKYLSRIIADCYQLLGRRETIELLDRMKEIGLPRIDALRAELRRRRPAHAGEQGDRAQGDGQGSREGPQAVRQGRSSPRPSATTR